MDPPPPSLCRLAGPAGWGFEYMFYYWAYKIVLYGDIIIDI